MKKIYILTTVAFAALSLASCKKFLDQPSINKYDSETIFESVGRAEMVVVGAYSQTFNREMYYQLGMGTDECMSTEGTTNSKNQVANYVYTPSISPTSTYTAMYASIEYVNVAIKGLQGMTVADADKTKWNMLLGEAYAIRAMNYLNLVRYFGDVPYSTLPVGETNQFTSSRVSRDTIYDGCVSDLQKAVELLPWKSAGLVPTTERFTKNAALGMLARVALYAAGYSLRWDLNTYAASSCKIAQRSDVGRIKELYGIAADACQKAMGSGENALLPKFETVFRNLVTGKYDNECMLLFGQWGTSSNGSVTGYTNGIYSHVNSMYAKAQPAMAVTPTYWFDFGEGDQRRDVTICNYLINSDNGRDMNAYSSNTIGKYRVNWMATTGTGTDKRDIDWPVLRYSDVLLMYAEALNEYNNGPTAEAKAAFEEVRKRGYGGDASKIGTTPSDYAGFRNAIILERKLEFGFESLRRTDLARWGILYETLTQTKQNLNDMANVTGAYANIDRYRVYKRDKATSFQDPVVSVPYTGYNVLSPEDSTTLAQAGNVVLRMHSGGNVTLFSQGALEANNALIQNLFRGLEREKVEILPLATSLIDINPGLAGQQHPKY
ncbi:Starch-binding associating with outer membrane [Filimonas lacunae]|uniref:Starch-binding associating with outer membrane n=1 Tax=Filimonas lacunae TaxID=477680 RepID=A0A173MCU0_9BACT|nr:RagB/SusD family nutrient uptake outer membrane protein [Filimonas lacunae]BAV05271.1 outer membrane protein, nutrient binding [Filimonas lacunae]SIT22282.1 Starch-binding associating with outer membrane [Filimonas lacunae]